MFYLSFTHSDRVYAERFEIFIKPLLMQTGHSLWTRSGILPGKAWEEKLKEYFLYARFFVALISADYLADSLCYKETLLALFRHKQGKLVLIPVLIRPCDYANSLFSALECIPAKPVSLWRHPDEAWVQVIQSIRRRI